MRSIHTLGKILSFIHIAFFCVALTGCATVSGTLIGPDIQTPTVTEENAVDLSFYSLPGRQLTLFSDASNRPPTYSTDLNAIGSEGGSLLGGLGYGASKSISISGGLLASDALLDGAWLGGKIQLLGPQGFGGSSFLLSVYGRAGTQFGSSSGDKNGEFGPGGFPWEASRTGSFFNGGVSAGLALARGFIPFVGYAIGTAKVGAELKQSATNSDAGGTFNRSERADMTTWGGGIQLFDGPFRFSVGANRSRTKIGAYKALETMTLLSLEFRVNTGAIGNAKHEVPAN